jgi:hypothetical protein
MALGGRSNCPVLNRKAKPLLANISHQTVRILASLRRFMLNVSSTGDRDVLARDLSVTRDVGRKDLTTAQRECG